LLPEVASEALLDEYLVGPRDQGLPPARPLPSELRPLGETLTALSGAPSLSEFRGEAAAMAAFRAGFQGGEAYTLPLEVPHDLAGRRPHQARHRAPAGTRPGSRRPAGRPPARRRIGLTAVAAAALAAVIGTFAYSGHLPGPFQNAAHVAIGAPSARTSPSAHPDGSAGGGTGLTGPSATQAPTPTPTPAPTSGTAQEGPRQWCEAYFANPWKPGSTSWDKADFEKLAKVARGPQWVLWYCFKLNQEDGHGSPSGDSHHYPDGYEGGPWAWIPGSQGNGPAFRANVSRQGDGNSQSGATTPQGPASTPSPTSSKASTTRGY
jgi:hypothetical protein